MTSIDALHIPEAKKRYITESLNPLLEEMVTDCLTNLPDDPISFMIDWLRTNKLGENLDNTDFAAENQKLKDEIEKQRAKVKEAAAVIADTTAEDAGDEDDEESDDEVDELPTNFLKPVSQMWKARASVSAEVYGNWNKKQEFAPPMYQKTDEQKRRIKDVLAKSFLFAALEEKELNVVILAMKEVKLEPKTRIIKQGDDGDFLFVIETGTLDCYKKFPDEIEERIVKTCEPGDTFGELALLYNCPRAASVESRDACMLWQLDRETFNHIVKDAAAKKRERYEASLKKVSLLETINTYERSQIADALKTEFVQSGTTVISQGDQGDKFYIIEEGTVVARKSKDGSEAVKVMEYGPGDYFGELSLLRDEPRAASIVATSDCKLLVLDRRSFKRLLGPLQDLLSRASAKYT